MTSSEPASDNRIRHSMIRRRTAQHMTRAKQTVPHVWVSTRVDYSAVDRARRSRTPRLSYLPFVVRAATEAIRSFPILNGSFEEDAIVVHDTVDVGIAVDLDFKGLVVPVVRNATARSVDELAADIDDLATRARSRKLLPDEVAGGTITVTSLGAFGSHETLPIINHPQVAILSADGVSRQPIVVGSAEDGTEKITIAPVGMLVLGWDHRVFDGAYAAGYLREVKDLLEKREW